MYVPLVPGYMKLGVSSVFLRYLVLVCPTQPRPLSGQLLMVCGCGSCSVSPTVSPAMEISLSLRLSCELKLGQGWLRPSSHLINCLWFQITTQAPEEKNKRQNKAVGVCPGQAALGTGVHPPRSARVCWGLGSHSLCSCPPRQTWANNDLLDLVKVLNNLADLRFSQTAGQKKVQFQTNFLRFWQNTKPLRT